MLELALVMTLDAKVRNLSVPSLSIKYMDQEWLYDNCEELIIFIRFYVFV